MSAPLDAWTIWWNSLSPEEKQRRLAAARAAAAKETA